MTPVLLPAVSAITTILTAMMPVAQGVVISPIMLTAAPTIMVMALVPVPTITAAIMTAALVPDD